MLQKIDMTDPPPPFILNVEFASFRFPEYNSLIPNFQFQNSILVLQTRVSYICNTAYKSAVVLVSNSFVFNSMGEQQQLHYLPPHQQTPVAPPPQSALSETSDDHPPPPSSSTETELFPPKPVFDPSRSMFHSASLLIYILYCSWIYFLLTGHFWNFWRFLLLFSETLNCCN